MSYVEVHEELKDFLHRSRIPAINQSWSLANLIATKYTAIMLDCIFLKLDQILCDFD